MQKNKLHIALIGYGKMGKIIDEIATSRGHTVTVRAGSETPINLDLSKLSGTDVAIEFSVPEAAVSNLEILAEAGIPTICGTTGWLDEYDRICRKFRDSKTPFIYASNFSIGVNIFFKINRYLASWMNRFPEYNASVFESHHIQKKDAPSGTAVTLADQIIEESENLSQWHKGTDYREGSLPVASHREGDVKGLHEIIYTSEIDQIKIRHEAFERKGFALGALMAAEWIIGREGIFTMDDVMGSIGN